MAKSSFFRHITGEESLNDFFASLLDWSLREDPGVLNSMHPNLEFDSSARVVATQRNGLSEHAASNSRDRTLDWVVRDTSKLVGYESKRGNNAPSENQLTEEHSKL